VWIYVQSLLDDDLKGQCVCGLKRMNGFAAAEEGWHMLIASNAAH
jgi:hypothetical protein